MTLFSDLVHSAMFDFDGPSILVMPRPRVSREPNVNNSPVSIDDITSITLFLNHTPWEGATLTKRREWHISIPKLSTQLLSPDKTPLRSTPNGGRQQVASHLSERYSLQDPTLDNNVATSVTHMGECGWHWRFLYYHKSPPRDCRAVADNTGILYRV